MADQLCWNCGKPVPPGAHYCIACGSRVVADTPPQAGAPGAEDGGAAGAAAGGAAGAAAGAAASGPTPPGGGAPSYMPPYGQGQPPYGQQPYGQGQPPYGQPPYGQPPQQPPAYDYSGWSVYAGFWRRLVAIIIDGIILSIAGSIIRYGILGPVLSISTGGFAPSYELVSLVISWLYFTLLEASSHQATLGKMAMGIAVTDMDGRRISWGRANARYWSKYLSTFILMIGWLMAGFTEKKQALHDMIAGTLVVKRERY